MCVCVCLKRQDECLRARHTKRTVPQFRLLDASPFNAKCEG